MRRLPKGWWIAVIILLVWGLLSIGVTVVVLAFLGRI